MRVLALLALPSLAALVACAGGDSVACGQIEQILEPRASIHVIPGHEVEYRYRPPTSGPHYASDPDPGVREDPLPEADQVAALELGKVVVQYSDDVPAAEAAGLGAAASGRTDVIVAPAAGRIDGGRAVAFTAWGLRQRCTGASVGAALEFVESTEEMRRGLRDQSGP